MKKLVAIVFGILVLSGCTFQGINHTYSDPDQRIVDDSTRH